MRRRIALYVHPAHGFGPRYLLYRFVERWRRTGIETAVVDDPARTIDAEIGFLHVDLTRVPPAYREIAGRYPVVVNGARADVSKRSVSGHLLTRDSDYVGPVIVKSDENMAGIPDDRARGWRIIWHPRVRGALDRLLPTAVTGGVFSWRYHVYDSLADVPRVVWSIRRLVVEKFLPEQVGDQYCMRYAKVLGDRHIFYQVFMRRHYPKGGNILARRRYDPPAAELAQLRAWQERFGIDYAKFDYTLVDGEAALLDINPTNGVASTPESDIETAELMADGIESFFEEARRRVGAGWTRRGP